VACRQVPQSARQCVVRDLSVVVGVLAGAVATVIYASSKNWSIVIPAEA
jgi:hypothetical protein